MCYKTPACAALHLSHYLKLSNRCCILSSPALLTFNVDSTVLLLCVVVGK